MTSKPQISQARQAELENQIAMQSRIMRETHDIMRELDPDTLTHFSERFSRILKAARKTKLELIERMNDEKEQAQLGRQSAD